MIYPNPTTGNFMVESKGGTLSVMGLDGRLIGEYDLKEGKDKVGLPQGLAAGMYMLEYHGPKAGKVLRLVYQP